MGNGRTARSGLTPQSRHVTACLLWLLLGPSEDISHPMTLCWALWASLLWAGREMTVELGQLGLSCASARYLEKKESRGGPRVKGVWNPWLR